MHFDVDGVSTSSLLLDKMTVGSPDRLGRCFDVSPVVICMWWFEVCKSRCAYEANVIVDFSQRNLSSMTLLSSRSFGRLFIVCPLYNPRSNMVKERASMLLVHGLIHLLGYDHETEEDYLAMVQLEEKILKAVFDYKQ